MARICLHDESGARSAEDKTAIEKMKIGPVLTRHFVPDIAHVLKIVTSRATRSNTVIILCYPCLRYVVKVGAFHDKDRWL